MNAPSPSDGDKYLWWCRGADDEARARKEGLSAEALQLLDLVDALAKRWPEEGVQEVVKRTARICCPEILKRKYRK